MPPRGYDYIVVGAGAAGCIVAARLSENPDMRVLLLEAGGSDRGLATTVPLLTFLASASAKRNWSFTTEPIPGLNGRRQVWNQGRLIGGSGSINGMLYLRGCPAEYEAWRQAGGEGWSFDDLLPFFKKTETNSRGEGRWHGGGGPIATRPARSDVPICGAFLKAVEASGYPLVDDLNACEGEGFGTFDVNIGGGVRMSSARSYLDPARRRAK